MSSPRDLDVYWGDFHKHITGPGSEHRQMDDVIEAAKEHLDIYPVLCYPFSWFRHGGDDGLKEETVGNQPPFQRWWQEVQEAARRHHAPGRFVTFPAYEWNGDRTRWGDHNVIYRRAGGTLCDAAELTALYRHAREQEALVLPHHTGYAVGHRGKDWQVFDADVSPVMEVYSVHGSSEGVSSPLPMPTNHSMGPRTSGGTLHDALARGHRVGIIASNDYSGLPGTWNLGVAGIWAEDLSREAVWQAVKARRTYGVTGDRLRLWWTLNDRPMGSDFQSQDALTASVSVSCPQPLDRVELIHNGRVAATYTHQDRWWRQDPAGDTYSVLLEFGWGPSDWYGDFGGTQLDWQGSVEVEGGELQAVQPRFQSLGQHYEHQPGRACRFELTTARDHDEYHHIQGLILTLKAGREASLIIRRDGREPLRVARAELDGRSQLLAFVDEAEARIQETFEVPAQQLRNRDPLYHNAAKLLVHPAYPRQACEAQVTFDRLPRRAGDNYYYVRASQVDGQYAWASPIWVSE